ncbi:MAG TPA: hypothetical protein VFX61_17940 [Micromonosporaceae bacterium]|jgi:hypothetical protein|nr:hypothetical protein [Micromonosporaceae bacterium]
MTILALFALAVVGLGNENVSAESGASPRPQPTVQYPVRFPSPEGHR